LFVASVPVPLAAEPGGIGAFANGDAALPGPESGIDGRPPGPLPGMPGCVKIETPGAGGMLSIVLVGRPAGG
jgi:hypothetical protein